jgi:hypothetical protein
MNPMTMPWDRVDDPVEIPDPCDAVRLRLLAEDQFGELLRSNLMPGKDCDRWRRLWVIIAFNQDLADRVLDRLDQWADLAQGASDQRAAKFAERCDEAWNRVLRVQQLDARPASDPKPGTTAHRFLMSILGHRHTIGEEQATKVDRAMWAAAGTELDRAPRGGKTTKDWAIAPTYTSQLIDAVRAHSQLTTFGNAADRELWKILRD